MHHVIDTLYFKRSCPAVSGDEVVRETTRSIGRRDAAATHAV
jgi:hypothetical protein